MARPDPATAAAQAAWAREGLDEVPVLDLADYNAGRPGALETLAEALRDAQESIGFYYLKNHGVPQDLIDHTFAEVARFHGLPLEEKLKIRIDADQTGYIPMGGTVIRRGELGHDENKPDRTEAFWLRRERRPDDPELGLRFRAKNKWPADLPGFRERLLAYVDRMEQLGRSLLPIYATALGQRPTFFDDKFDRADLVCRFGHYPPGQGGNSRQFGAGAHTDAGFVTLLPQAVVPGLEILTQSGKWLPAPVRPGEILVNGGDSLVRFTNGRFLATPHRVVAEIPRDRYSIPLFYNPNFDTVLTPVESCVSAERPSMFEPLTYFDYIVWYLAQHYPHQAAIEAA